MNLIIAAVGYSDTFANAVRAAKRRSGCDVYVLCDRKIPISDTIVIDVNRMEPTVRRLIELNALDQIRWFMLRHLINLKGLQGPFICLDWDVLVFHSINDHIGAMSNFKVLCTQEDGTSVSAANAVSDINTLDGYLDHLRTLTSIVSSGREVNDMFVWRDFCCKNSIEVGNLAEEYDGGVFDHNIHTGGTKYVFDGETKAVVWKDGYPFFKTLENDRLVKARLIHCWKSYKTRTDELIKLSGIQ